MKKWIKKVIDFFKTGKWQTEKPENAKEKRFGNYLKLVLFTLKGAGDHEVSLRSAALTIYTIMSLVPIAALIFGILKGFGFEANLTDFLYERFPDYSNIVDTLLVFVNRMLAKTRGGVIAAVGVVVLVWSVMKVFGNIEDAFNKIWEIKKGRTLVRKFGDYVAVIFIAPIFLVASISLGTIIRNYLSFLNASWLINILLGLASMILICALLAFIYWLMPNTKVKIKWALISGAIAGTVLYIFSLLYFLIQGSVSSYNAIYGTFAAIPLFLAWMQIGWQIVLTGSELSYACQNISRYESEHLVSNMDDDHKRKVLLATMVTLAKHFLNNNGAANPEEIATELNLPVRIVRDMIFKLEKAGLILAVDTNKDNDIDSYIPAKDVHSIKVSEVMDVMDKNPDQPDILTSPEMKAVNNLINKMRNNAYSPELNVYLPELMDKMDKKEKTQKKDAPDSK